MWLSQKFARLERAGRGECDRCLQQMSLDVVRVALVGFVTMRALGCTPALRLRTRLNVVQWDRFRSSRTWVGPDLEPYPYTLRLPCRLGTLH